MSGRLIAYGLAAFVAIVVLANRCDSEGALAEAELRTRLALARSLEKHTWRLVLCDTMSGKGLEEGLGFLADEMKEL